MTSGNGEKIYAECKSVVQIETLVIWRFLVLNTLGRFC